jgi:DNA-binding NtrC family response regulator
MDVVIVGGDAALQEGVLQAMRSAGFRAEAFRDAASARDATADAPPLALVVHVNEARRSGAATQIPLRPGGAVILFRDGEHTGASAEQAFGRAVVAELSLPLERARLTALVSRIVERARVTGRDRQPPDPSMSP